MIEREIIHGEDEILVFSFFIMNDEVASAVFAAYKTGYLKTKYFTDFFRPIFRSVIIYYSRYGKAPRHTINEIVSRIKIDEDNKAIAEEYLDNVAEEYARIEENASADAEYIIKEVLPNFIKDRQASKLIEDVDLALRAGRYDKAENLIGGYQGYVDIEDDIDTGTVVPFSHQTVKDYYSTEPESRVIFRLPGPAGQIIGPITRKKFIAVTGVEKSGKSTMLMEMAYTASKYFKQNVLWINLEMDSEDLSEMFWRRLTHRASDREHAGMVTSPVFDCLNNQLDRCGIEKSLNGGRLAQPGKIISLRENSDWKVCTKCRGSKRFRKETKRFVPAIWFEKERIKVIRKNMILKAIDVARLQKLHRIKTKTFPRLAAKFGQVESYIKRYIKKYGEHPLVILDYCDILQPEEGKLLTRENVDYIWKKAAGLAHELDCAIISPDQAVKTARGKRSIGREDTSESKTKDAHLDIRLTLNMTPEEEEAGIQRLGILYRRKGRVTNQQVMMLQRRETAEMIRDSEWWIYRDSGLSVKK